MMTHWPAEDLATRRYRAATTTGPRQASPGGQLTIAAAGTVLVLVAFTVPLGTLSARASALHAGPGGQAWILSAMSLGAAGGLLASGALGDDRGRRRVFLAGVVLLGVTSLVGALAPNALVLILARVVQGVGGAAILACSLGLVSHAYPPGPGRNRATGLWGAAVGAGVAIGPFLSVGLTALGSWRLPYLATTVVATALAICGRLVLAESRAAEPRPVDVAGTLLLGLGLAGVLAGLVQGRASWTAPLTLALLVAGVALLVGFVMVEHRSTRSMLDLALFQRPDFVGATVAAVAAGAGLLALSNVVPTVVERGLWFSALVAVTVLFAWSGTSALTALGARWIPARVSPRLQLVVGLAGMALGQLAMTGVQPTSSALRLLPGLLVAGAFNGFVNAALGRQAVASVPADRAAMGTAGFSVLGALVVLLARSSRRTR
jgi:MFS family permease